MYLPLKYWTLKKNFIYSEMPKSNHNVPIMIHVHVGYIPPPPYTFWMGYVLYPFQSFGVNMIKIIFLIVLDVIFVAVRTTYISTIMIITV